MPTNKITGAALLLALMFSQPAFSSDDMAGEHGGGIFHMFKLETDYGGGPSGRVFSWDFEGWIGGDVHKLWLKSEGDHADDKVHEAELWALYSRNISTFWDAQIGVRHDVEPTTITYAVLGFDGLAPYFIETEAHMFISGAGDVSARLRLESDFLATQKLIFQPYVEIDLYAQDVPEREIGVGFTSGKVGLQTRYEFTRKFAPYLDLRYDRKLGRTETLARREGEDAGEFVAAIGLRLMF